MVPRPKYTVYHSAVLEADPDAVWGPGAGHSLESLFDQEIASVKAHFASQT